MKPLCTHNRLLRPSSIHHGVSGMFLRVRAAPHHPICAPRCLFAWHKERAQVDGRVPMMGVPQMDPRSAPDMMGAPEGEETRMGMRTEPRGPRADVAWKDVLYTYTAIYIHSSHGEPWS